MVLEQLDFITVDGIPAHPLLVHAVVVLLPLAALGGLVIAARAAWRRRFGLVVLALTAAGVAAVPLAEETGEQLQGVLPAANPLIQEHAARGDDLLPFAIAFGVAVLLLVIAGRLADRERDAALVASDAADGHADGHADAGVSGGAAPGGAVATADTGTAVASRTWRRVAIVAAALVAFTGVATTVQVVRIGHSGASAVWQGVGP